MGSLAYRNCRISQNQYGILRVLTLKSFSLAEQGCAREIKANGQMAKNSTVNPLPDRNFELNVILLPVIDSDKLNP